MVIGDCNVWVIYVFMCNVFYVNVLWCVIFGYGENKIFIYNDNVMKIENGDDDFIMLKYNFLLCC